MLVAQRSWELLNEREREAALRLGVCADFDPADTPALGVSDRDLDALLTHSFLETYQPGSERLRVYPALTGVLNAQAQAHPALVHAARRAHAEHYLTWFTAQPPESPPVDLERGNLRLAVSNALRHGTLQASTVNHLLAHYDRRGLLGSGTDVFALLADEAEDAAAPADVQAATQIACMWLAYRAGRLLDAQTLAARFLQGPLAGDPVSRMKVLNTLGSVRAQQGQYQASVDLIRQALALAEQLGDRMRVVGYRMNILGSLSFFADTAEIRAELAAIVRLLPELPESLVLHVRRYMLQTSLYLPDTDLDALLAEVSDVQMACERLGDVSSAMLCLTYRSRINLRQGNLREAQAVTAHLREMLRTVEDAEIEIEVALLDTALLYARGRAMEARRSAGEALPRVAKGSNPWTAIELFLIVAADLLASDPAGVRAFAAAIAQDHNIHSEQRRRAEAVAGPNPSAGPPLDVGALRAWLHGHLDPR